jgi:hypothetical protein
VALGPIWRDSNSGSPRRDPVFVNRPRVGWWHVAADPIIGTRELPRGVESTRIRGEIRLPQLRGLPRAGQVRAIGVERIRNGRLRQRVTGREIE